MYTLYAIRLTITLIMSNKKKLGILWKQLNNGKKCEIRNELN